MLLPSSIAVSVLLSSAVLDKVRRHPLDDPERREGFNQPTKPQADIPYPERVTSPDFQIITKI